MLKDPYSKNALLLQIYVSARASSKTQIIKPEWLSENFIRLSNRIKRELWFSQLRWQMVHLHGTSPNIGMSYHERGLPWVWKGSVISSTSA